MTPRTFIKVLIGGGLIALVLACLTAAAFVAGRELRPFLQPVAAVPVTPRPTFTLTPTPTFTLTPTLLDRSSDALII